MYQSVSLETASHPEYTVSISSVVPARMYSSTLLIRTSRPSTSYQVYTYTWYHVLGTWYHVMAPYQSESRRDRYMILQYSRTLISALNGKCRCCASDLLMPSWSRYHCCRVSQRGIAARAYLRTSRRTDQGPKVSSDTTHNRTDGAAVYSAKHILRCCKYATETGMLCTNSLQRQRLMALPAHSVPPVSSMIQQKGWAVCGIHNARTRQSTQ